MWEPSWEVWNIKIVDMVQHFGNFGLDGKTDATNIHIITGKVAVLQGVICLTVSFAGGYMLNCLATLQPESTICHFS